ncbi:retention module-containing protein [Alcaligenes ammonioxydans]|uniref:retention module-containing protein n=1 Tax=Alcaligenes ammonioxydans TaxID=2582914 RepID=UPI0023DB42F9|nr:retention module-containing protein [Alcaligenes ammonioxydans]
MALDTVLVTQVQGTAWIRTSDGAKVAVQEGMRVPVNAEIVTETGASVELQIPGSPPMTISDNREFLVSGDIAETDADAVAAALANPDDPAITAVLAALESGQDPFAQLDPTAAVLTGGGEGGGSSFTRLVSIVETTRPLALEYPRPDVPTIENVRLGGYSGGDEDPTLVTGTTAITLETPDHITEGDPYEIVARVGQPVTSQDLVISLTNGSTITIPVGSTEGRVTVGNPYPDDVYRQGDRPETVGVTGTTGGNYEDLDTSSTTTTTVKDDSDKTTITLESPTDVVEGKEYEIVARVDNPVTGEDLVIQLDNGKTITIPVGSSEGKVTITPRDDDAYKQGDEPVTVGITGTTGGNYENLDTSSTTTTKVVDDTDEVIATLTATPDSITEEGGAITYTVTLTNKDGLSVKEHSGLTITLADGTIIEIAAGQASGSQVVDVPANDDNVIGGQDAITNSIDKIAGGEVFEQLTPAGQTSVGVTDEPVDPENPGQPVGDKVTVVLGATEETSEDGGKVVYTAKLVDADGNAVTTNNAITVTLRNGETITIEANASSGQVETPVERDDVFVETDAITNAITDIDEANAGQPGAFENLTYDGSDVTTKVVDDTDEVIATLTAIGQPTLGAEITYQVTLTNKDNLPIDKHGKITVTLDSGKVIEIPAGDTTGSITFKLTQAGALTDGIKSVVVDGDVQFEKLTSTGAIDLNVTNIAPTVGEGKAVVSEEGLPGGIKDNQGTSDTTDKTLVTGKLAISDPDSNHLTVKLVAPADGNITSGGVAVKWTVGADGALVGKAGSVEVIKASIDNEGNYKVELKAPVDHPVKGQEDTLNFDIGVKVSDETSTVTSKIVVTVEDDSPAATNVAQTLTVPVSEVLVTGLQGGFKNWKYVDGYNSGKKQYNKDSDSYHEELRWGASGYDYYDNERFRNNTENLIGSTFKLGTFKHINQPISGGELASTDLVVKFNVTIDGVIHQIEHTIKLKHTETPNDRRNPGNDASRDIVEIEQSSLTKVFTVGGRTFEFTIDGFKNDEYGNPVSTVRTWEQKTNTYDLYATISAVDDMPKIEGKLDGDVYSYGADGAATGGQGVVWENAVKQWDGSYKIVNEFGTFIGKSDGSYTFEMSRDARDKMIVNDLKDMTFKYSVTDQDGDSAVADLTITLKGQPNNAPEEGAFRTALAVDDSSEVVVGTDGNDSLVGTDGNDTLIGGAGDDIMFGGEGDDTFVWNKGDQGTTNKPAVDHVMDFGGAGTDTLDISDLLSGHGINEGNLSQYLTVSRSDSGKMEIGISSQGNGQIDQKIILDNIDFDAEKAAQIANSLKDGTLKSSDF